MDTKFPPTPQNAARAPADDPAAQAAVRLGYEPTDVNVKRLFLFTGALFASLVVIFLGLVVLFKVYQHADHWLDARRARSEPGAESLVHVRPEYAGPLLQVKPEEDLRWMKAHNARDLEDYGWIDRSKGVVRIPVARAMDVIAERGLPPESPGLTLEAIQRQRADPQVWGQALRP
jgi:hypothetical protein